jgi:hypothetical protein
MAVVLRLGSSPKHVLYCTLLSCNVRTHTSSTAASPGSNSSMAMSTLHRLSMTVMIALSGEMQQHRVVLQKAHLYLKTP